jgi:erythromycin esterase-like protein
METFLDGRTPELLALGEPTHAEPAFPRLRNQVFQDLVARGFRSIAIESDRVAGLRVDDHVRGDAVLPPDGFSHGMGDLAANQELVAWMREYNRSVPAGRRVAFHGFDAPLEMTAAPSPGPYLREVCAYLGWAAPEVDDARWSDPAGLMDAGSSVGGSAQAQRLRVLADDALGALDTAVPSPAAGRVRLSATAALWLLRYHAVAARPAPAAQRTSRLLAVRDAWMARNLLGIRAAERDRGPTLVFAHNRHLQRNPSRWTLAGMELQWAGAGMHLSSLLGERYVVVVGSLGGSAALGLGAPAADTIEGGLSGGPLFAAADVPGAAAVREAVDGYFPLDAETVAGCDGVWHVDRYPAAAQELAARVRLLDGVEETHAGPGTGAPELAWDEHFFFAGGQRRNPFATIVGHDIAGFDARSRLDRAGVYRLNIELGRDEFRRLFGYGPEDFAEYQEKIDFSVLDELMPHPVYAAQGWGCVLNPGSRSGGQVTHLLSYARDRAARRRRP